MVNFIRANWESIVFSILLTAVIWFLGEWM